MCLRLLTRVWATCPQFSDRVAFGDENAAMLIGHTFPPLWGTNFESMTYYRISQYKGSQQTTAAIERVGQDPRCLCCLLINNTSAKLEAP